MVSSNLRLFVWLGLGLALWLNYEAWNRLFAPPPAPPAAPAAGGQAGLGAAVPQAAPPAAAATASAGGAPSTSGPLNPALPAPAMPAAGLPPTAVPTPAATAPQSGSGPTAPGASVQPPEPVVRVVTDVLDLDIALQGGELRRAELLRYPLVKGQAKPVRLFNRDAEGFYLLQTGLAPGAAGDAAPTHLATFGVAAQEYRLSADANELRVPLTWTDGQGVTVTKTFLLRRGHYRIDLEYAIENRSSQPFSAASYAQIWRDDILPETSMFNVESYSYQGPAYYDGNKYTKLALKNEEHHRFRAQVQGGWIAGMQHHFVAAVVPAATQAYQYALQVSGRQYLLSA
ncbi:MAG: membrane protein insertase YidC, partial [Gammaproteobacteria bacterium]|nr:membrane protein insertase YidC [Gammaproteobacteria bacterium]